jgi:hypothetical protein
LYHEGEIRDAAGTLLARGRGRFVVVDLERFAQRAAGNAAGEAARDNAGKAARNKEMQ